MRTAELFHQFDQLVLHFFVRLNKNHLTRNLVRGTWERSSSVPPVPKSACDIAVQHENLEGAVSKVWHADPWIGGAVSYPSPGQMNTICVAIERPEGRVHFAGELQLDALRCAVGG